MKRSVFWGVLPAAMIFFLLPGKRVDAQKISFETVKVKYIRLPLQPLPPEVKTFYSEVTIPQVKDDPKYQHYRVPVAGLKYTGSPESAGVITELTFREFVGLDPKLVSDKVYRVNTAQNETGYYYELVNFKKLALLKKIHISINLHIVRYFCSGL
jgi:hypothetical protein